MEDKKTYYIEDLIIDACDELDDAIKKLKLDNHELKVRLENLENK